MITLTGAVRLARAGGDADAESPRGSPEPGLAIVPLDVVPLTGGYLIGSASAAARATDGMPRATAGYARSEPDAE
jgi:hypothetical protein